MKKYNSLKSLGIKKRYNRGLNKYGYREITVVLQDRTVWDLIPEYNIYERREGIMWNEGMKFHNI